MEGACIRIRGARVNNLKNITLDIPRGKFTVITGISGSGKSSLAFDTLFAEGQRRFAESLSSYARQFLGRMSKPDVDGIDGIPPAIAIEQKVNIRNPRSTVATTTELYDFLRILFARTGRTYSPVSGREVRRQGPADVMEELLAEDGSEYAYLLADLHWKQREDHTELLLSLTEEGFSRLWAEGRVLRIDEALQRGADSLDEAFLLVDRVRTGGGADADVRTRWLASVATAFEKGDGTLYVRKEPSGDQKTFCNRLELDGMRFRDPEEYLFSFNSPLGACPVCGGLGKIIGVSEDLVIPDKGKSIYEGAVACWRGEKMGWFKDLVVRNAERYGIPVFEPYAKLSQKAKDTLWDARYVEGDETTICGIRQFFEWVEANRYKIQYKYMLSRFSGRTTCHACGGSRLRPEALYVRVGGKTIHDLLRMDVDSLLEFFNGLVLTPTEHALADNAVKEICTRLRYIQDVGLGYLTLDRASNTLSGGESQRINLVTALGSSLVGSMYILDEPSIGLHPRDTDRLIGVLRRLRDLGNTVVVVEHDERIMAAADYLVDLGPMAGEQGGEVVFEGTLPPEREGRIPAEAFSREQLSRSLTLRYVTGLESRYVRSKRPWNYSITVEGAMEHNLKGIDVRFPLGVMTVVTGVSGSGKSTLVNDILFRALARHLGDSADAPGTYSSLGGDLDLVKAVEFVDQDPIGKSSRSNPAIYLKAFDEIRQLFAQQQLSKQMGYNAGFFSFNSPGGRCEECKGDGKISIEMQFMANITLTCDTCHGRRFSNNALEVLYRGKSIYDVLEMTVNQAIEFFSEENTYNEKKIVNRLKPLQDVGLGYIKLGQSSSTLSGGENQRVKLASFLSGEKKNHTLFIFDEPTTGLHFHDINTLMKSFNQLIDRGNTIIIIEHNLEVIKCADHIIDLGPEGGEGGGTIVVTGTPEQVAKHPTSHTAKYLRSMHN